MDKCREEFEAWIKSETGLDLYRTQFPMTKYEDQQYHNHSTNLAWFSWKASRESMQAIKLPDNVFVNNNVFGSLMSECANQMRESCKDAITSAGYKVE